MKRALIIAITIHFGLLLAAGYIYVLRPGKKEEVFRAFLHAEKAAPMKKIRTMPPKKELKKTPAVRPLRRERPIELIAVKRAITSAFTVKLPEVSGAAYSPQIALVSVPEPTLAPERLPSFWEREIELKGRAIQLESFGVTTLKPLGSPENPVTCLIFTGIPGNPGVVTSQSIGIFYPEYRELVHNYQEGQDIGTFEVGPYAVPPEEFVFYAIGSYDFEGKLLLSTDPNHCRRARLGPNVIRFTWEISESSGGDWNDLVFTVTFVGAQSGM